MSLGEQKGCEIRLVVHNRYSRYIFFVSKSHSVHHLHMILKKDNVVKK
jgi:hypothetical protein